MSLLDCIPPEFEGKIHALRYLCTKFRESVPFAQPGNPLEVALQAARKFSGKEDHEEGGE